MCMVNLISAKNVLIVQSIMSRKGHVPHRDDRGDVLEKKSAQP